MPSPDEDQTGPGRSRLECEAQFRSFAQHSSSLLWIADLRSGVIEYRSPAYEQIWGELREDAVRTLDEWVGRLHPDDQSRVRRALDAVEGGEVAHVEYRIIRPVDRGVRWLRDTSFPIPDGRGEVVRIGGIAENFTRQDGQQLYVVGASKAEERRFAGLMRRMGARLRTFPTPDAFLDLAPFLRAGCVLVDLRQSRRNASSIALELRSRAPTLKVVVLGADNVATAVEAVKSGASDYLPTPVTDAALTAALQSVWAEVDMPHEGATEANAARIDRLSPREREVLDGLINGGTNKSIALQIGLSPRTVELHRGQVMTKLNASSLAELLQSALAAGLCPISRRA